MFTAKDVMALREMSGAGMMDCKRALVETDGDMDKAMEYLREKSLAATAKKASRIAAEGIVDSYIHMGGRIGVLVEVNCETDFVAKTDEFKNLVAEIAKQMGLLDPKDFKFLWVTEFPMFEWSEEEGRYMAMHHPFTAPMVEDEDKILTDKANCRARAYDIVLNGTELGGGSIRINTPEMQEKSFQALGISEEDIQERFGHLVNAFKFGAPPHGGLAYGLDRLCMLMAGAPSIRDVIAFPKVQNASDLMMACPDVVDAKQLDDLSIAVTRMEETSEAE